MTQIGIDTSVPIGLLDPQDVWHDPATALQQAFKVHGASVAVFDCVLAEAISTMARRIHEQRRSTDLDRPLSHNW
jgi:predicted nucleic acid-binding protein